VKDRIEAPRWLAEHAEAFRASGRSPATPRLAATVVLMRPRAEGGFEVYVQRRAATMAFAPGMYAFPGGSVDAADYDPESADDRLAAQLGLSGADAAAVHRAAVRELHEEAGVRLPVDAVRPWARWLTPEFEPKRFDTFFFVAAMPADQRTRDDGIESDLTAWLAPADASTLPMLPPTRYTLAELARYDDVTAVLAAAGGRDLSTPVQPVIEVDADGVWLRRSGPVGGDRTLG
jgi:8-oxo-dGTP pyrophosphatase MutT (NUDIX family)